MTEEMTSPAPEAATTGPVETSPSPEAQAPISDILGSDVPTAAPVDTGPVDNSDFMSLLGDNNDLKVLVEKKGWKSVEDALNSYSNLESKMGSKFENLTADEIKEMNTKLGVPQDTDGYDFGGIEVADDIPLDDTRLNDFKDMALQAGLTNEQAARLVNDVYSKEVVQIKEQQALAKQQQEQDLNTLKEEYGLAFNDKKALANQALNEFDPSGEALQALKDAGLQSNPAIVKLLVQIGEMTGEEPAKGIKAERPSGAMAPADAKKEMSAMLSDREFMRRVNSGDTAAQAKFESIGKMMRGA